jgi:hypothetical protein
LLLGYVYAHLLARLPSVRLQIAVHVCVLLTPLAFLPLTFATGIGEAAFERPALALLRSLTITVGVPFFVVSTTAPLLQNWLARTDETAGKDPYFLYAASNAGSLLALLLYPFAVEPRIGVNAQTDIWSTGYGLLIALVAVTAGLVWRSAGTTSRSHKATESEPRPAWKTRLFWILTAFIASGLMLAVTNHITSNLAAAPFLWILPLAIYLLTFIVAFSPRLKVGSERVSRILPIILLALFPVVVADVIAPPGLNWVLIVLHLVLLYAGALLCHARLIRVISPNSISGWRWVAFWVVFSQPRFRRCSSGQSWNIRFWSLFCRSSECRPTRITRQRTRTGTIPRSSPWRSPWSG